MADFSASYPAGGSGGGGGGGVTSLNSETGNVILTSSTLTITTPSSFDINIEATGVANTFAGFDASGNLESIPGFNIDTTSGGMDETLLEHPNNVGGGFNANNFIVSFEPLQNSPNDDWNIQQITANFDNANSGFSQGTNGNAATLLNLNVNNSNTGPIGSVNQIKMYFNMGNGTDPLTIKGLAYALGFADINNNVTIDGQFQGYDFQPHIHSGALSTSNFNMYAFSDSANVEIPVNSYNSISLNPQILSINNNNNYQAIIANASIPTLTGNASLYGLSFVPTVVTMGATSQVIALNVGPSITTMGATAQYTGAAIGGVVTTSHGSITGVSVNPQINGGDAGFIGLNISPNGGATLTDPLGININLSQINSTNSQGIVGFQSDSRLQVNASTQLKAGEGFQIGSRIEHLFTVPAGSPVTGTDELAVNIAGDFLVQDDVANGPFGIGFNSVGFIASMGIAATKTVDSITVFLPAASLPDPGFASGGAVTEFHMIRTFPPLAQGGTAAITNLYAFKLDNMFGDFAAAATNAYGLYLDGGAIKNWISGYTQIGGTAFATPVSDTLDISGNFSSTGTFQDVTGNDAVDATNRILVDSTGNTTVDWENRVLKNADTDIVADWSDLDQAFELLGDLQITTLGKGIQIKTGANSKLGTAVLVGGTVTVSNTSITANSQIFLTSQVDGGVPGFLRITAKTVGTSFVITSSNVLDTSTVAWMIVESIP